MHFASVRIPLHPSEPFIKQITKELMQQCDSHFSPFNTRNKKEEDERECLLQKYYTKSAMIIVINRAYSLYVNMFKPILS